MFVLALLWVLEVVALGFNISSCMLKSCGSSEDRKTKDEWITEVANAEIEKNIYFGSTKTAYPISSSIVYLKVVVPDNLSDSKKIKQSQILIQPIDTKIKVFYN